MKIQSCASLNVKLFPATEHRWALCLNNSFNLLKEAFSLVLLEEEPAEAGKTTAREVVRGQVLDISPGSLQEKPAPPQPKPTIREVRCQENIDNLLSQLVSRFLTRLVIL